MRRFFLFVILMTVTMLVAPILTFVGYRGQPMKDENRKLKNELQLRGVKVSNWPKEFDSWYNDSIFLRATAISSYIYYWDRFLLSSVGHMYRGKNGDYFGNSEENPNVERFLGLHPLSREKLRRIKYSVAGTQAYCQLYGIQYLCFYIPDKASLYHENLLTTEENSFFSTEYGKSWHDQIMSTFRGSHLNFFDLTPIMLEGKKSARMYHYIVDPDHWNGEGSAVAYFYMRGVMASIRPDLFDKQKEAPFELYKNSTLKEHGELGISLRFLHPENYELHNEHLPEIMSTGFKYDPIWATPDFIVNKEKMKGRLFFASDSYFKSSVMPYVGKSVGQISPFVADFHEYLHMHWISLTMSRIREICENYHPDFFVEAFVERMKGIDRSSDSYLMSLADLILQNSTTTILTQEETPLTNLPSYHASWTEQGNALVFHSAGSKSYINTDTPPGSNYRITVNSDGFAVLIARLESPADTEALWEVKLANEPNAKWRRKAFKMKKGLNHVRIEFECRPGEIFEWKFTPGKVPGDYIFKPIPEAQMLRENVKTIRHFPSQL